ncbi:Thymidylate kinase [Salegentibacter holothuriorum]|uniref:Thymidylate kinase n=1 Tax=Salegentibacter holothuriorum TaxID=241145 RepID=A0A1T5DRL1_9FLAO|nr:Thymidylate kinase [Salegentibacter holothuriorum]
MKIDCLASDLLTGFFHEINHQNIEYAVLRNYEGLPYKIKSKDVDIVVNPTSLYKTEEILLHTAKKFGYQLIWSNHLDYLRGFSLVKLENNKVFSVKIDLFFGFKWHGCTYLNHDLIFDNINYYNDIKVPNKGHEALIMIVYYVLYAKRIDEKYHDEIYNNAVNNFENFQAIVHKTFKNKLGNSIIDRVKENKIKTLEKLRPQIKKDVVVHSFKNDFLIKTYLKHFITEVFDRNNMGTLIAFSGPDGAGKSTLVKVVMELFCSLGISHNPIPDHFLSNNVPSLHKLPGAPKKYAEQDYTKPYQTKTTGFFNSSLRTTYYYLAFLFDRLLFIKKKKRSNQIVVYDRYYTDLIVDPSRIRIGLKKSLVRKLFLSLPKPDFTFIILAEVDQILNRKEELSKDKLQELLFEYNELPKRMANCEVINNIGSLQEGQTNILKSVFDKLNKFN